MTVTPKTSIKHKPLSTDGKVDITHNADTIQNVPCTKITVELRHGSSKLIHNAHTVCQWTAKPEK